MVNAKLGMASNFVRILHTWNPLSIILDPPLSTPTGMSLNTQVIDRYWACDSGGHIRRHDPIFWTKISTTDFSALQDALQWDMEKTCVDWVAHYIDDFITIGASGSNDGLYANGRVERRRPAKIDRPGTKMPSHSNYSWISGLIYERRVRRRLETVSSIERSPTVSS